VRWYNTNTFYYTPIIKDEIRSDGKVILRRIEKRRLNGGTSFKVILPDPLTFAELADDRFYGNKEKLLFAFADNVLKEEVRHLGKNGVKYIQFSSPGLVARFREAPLSKDGLKQAGEAVRASLRGSSVRSGFHTFFGDASPYIPELFDAIPTDDIGFDFSQTDPESLSPSRKGIIAGVADGRSSYLESVKEMESKVGVIEERSGSKVITLSPSCDLRYVPRAVADAKLKRLSKLKEKLEDN
jgi:5-methyltetrahydropteroyltriglutamate--homocysteine methyltransferase